MKIIGVLFVATAVVALLLFGHFQATKHPTSDVDFSDVAAPIVLETVRDRRLSAATSHEIPGAIETTLLQTEPQITLQTTPQTTQSRSTEAFTYDMARNAVFRNDIDPFEHLFFFYAGDTEHDAPEENRLRDRLASRSFSALTVQALDCRESLCRVVLKVNDENTYTDLVSNVSHILATNNHYQLWELDPLDSLSLLVLYVARNAAALPDDYSRVSMLK